MALPSTFRENSRARLSAFLKIAEDMVSLQTEYNADNASGTFIPVQGDPIWLNYDMTRSEYMAMLNVLAQFITFYQGGSAPADATRPTALYKGKV